jgi:hypothetical protein
MAIVEMTLRWTHGVLPEGFWAAAKAKSRWEKFAREVSKPPLK